MEPKTIRALYVGDDFLGHPNGSVPPLVISPNNICNHIAIVLLLELVVVALDLVLVVGLSVDVGSLFGEVYHHLLLLGLLLDFLALEGLVPSLWHLKHVTVDPSASFFTMVVWLS